MLPSFYDALKMANQSLTHLQKSPGNQPSYYLILDVVTVKETTLLVTLNELFDLHLLLISTFTQRKTPLLFTTSHLLMEATKIFLSL